MSFEAEFCDSLHGGLWSAPPEDNAELEAIHANLQKADTTVLPER